MKPVSLWLLSTIVLNTIACNDHPGVTASNGTQTRDSFQIKVNIKGIPDGYATLKSGSSGVYKTIDSVPVKNGSFVFDGKLRSPEMVSVSVEPGGWNFFVFAENADISIDGDTTGSQYIDQTKYGGSKWATVKNITIRGSQSNDDLEKYNKDAAINSYDSVIRNFYAIAGKQKNKDDEYKYRDKADSVRNVQLGERIKWIDAYAKAHPSSVAGAYLFNNLYTIYQSHMRIGQADSMLHNFSGDAAASPYYKLADDILAKRKAVSPGQIAPDFTLLQRDSTKLTLSSLRGKYVMIDFWASWCHPCRQAIPHWKKVYAEYHPKGFEILSVSDDNRWPDWKKAMDIEKMPWLQVCDEFPEQYKPARVGDLYMINSIPFYVLLDKEGRILVYSGNEQDIVDALKKDLG